MGYLVYDGDCGFCTKCATWISRRGIAITPWQSIDSLEAIGLSVEMVAERVYWIEAGSAVSGGSEAVADALIASGSWRKPVGKIIRSRVVAPISHRVYVLIARNRYRMPGSTGTCKLPNN